MDNKKFGQKMKEKFKSKKMNDGINYIGIEIPEKIPGLESVLK